MKKEVIFLDKDKNIVPEEKATRVVIRETNKKGELMRETFGFIKKEKPEKDDREYEVTPEMQAVLDEFERKNKANKND